MNQTSHVLVSTTLQIENVPRIRH